MGNATPGYQNGIRVVEEDNVIDMIRREKHREQKERMAKLKEDEDAPVTSPNHEIRKFYGSRENYEDLSDAILEVVSKFAPEQEDDIELILRRYRGMEIKLYDKLEHLYSNREDYKAVDFDLNRLPHKGNLQTHTKHVAKFAQWMSRASTTVVVVQARVRQFLAAKRMARDKAAGTGAYAKRVMQKQQQDDDAASVASTDSKEEKSITSKIDVDTLAAVAFPADPATAAAPAPKKSRKSSRRRSKRSKRESKTKREPDMAHIVVSQRIQEALDRTQVSAELLFFMHDEKNTGRIDLKHFKQLCRQDLHIGTDNLTDKQLTDVFNAIDTSHDGELQLEELEAFLEAHTKLAKDTV